MDDDLLLDLVRDDYEAQRRLVLRDLFLFLVLRLELQLELVAVTTHCGDCDATADKFK